MRDPATGLFPTESFGSRLLLARVESYDILLDEMGTPKLDEQGNTVPTGLLNVSLLDKGGSRQKVPYVVAAGGNSMFLGGPPELGSLCIVGFRQSNDPVIIGFLPPSIHGLVSDRQTLPNLVPGEVFLQSSSKDVDTNGNVNFFRNARVWLDRYGRVRIEAQDYEFITGYILGNEFSPTVSRLKDPVTGNPIFMRERVGIGVERRVDDQGNAVFAFNKDEFTQVEGNKHTTVKGMDSRVANAGLSYTDGRGNGVVVTPDGILQAVANAGSFELQVFGNSSEEIGANQSVMIGGDRSKVVTKNETSLVGNKRDTTIGAGDKTLVATGNSTEKVVLGDKNISALDLNLLADVTARMDGELVRLGGLSAIPMVDGVVTGQGIDSLTGMPLWMLGQSSTKVMADKS